MVKNAFLAVGLVLLGITIVSRETEGTSYEGIKWETADYVEQDTYVPVSKADIRYPVRSRWWTGCKDWTHLTKGEHAGKFDHAWLASLTYEEIQSLHSDDHEGRTKWDCVVRPSTSLVSYAPTQNCPNGVCPNNRRYAPSYTPVPDRVSNNPASSGVRSGPVRNVLRNQPLRGRLRGLFGRVFRGRGCC